MLPPISKVVINTLTQRASVCMIRNRQQSTSVDFLSERSSVVCSRISVKPMKNFGSVSSILLRCLVSGQLEKHSQCTTQKAQNENEHAESVDNHSNVHPVFSVFPSFGLFFRLNFIIMFIFRQRIATQLT
jgi:hypothetical protein